MPNRLAAELIKTRDNHYRGLWNRVDRCDAVGYRTQFYDCIYEEMN